MKHESFRSTPGTSAHRTIEHIPDHCVAVRDGTKPADSESSIDVLGYPGPAGKTPVARLNQGSHKREQRTCWTGPAPAGQPTNSSIQSRRRTADHTGSNAMSHPGLQRAARSRDIIYQKGEENTTLPIDNTAAIATSKCIHRYQRGKALKRRWSHETTPRLRRQGGW